MSERKLRKLHIHELSPREQELVNFLDRRIVGQPQAVAALGRAYRSGLNPIANLRRPRATLLFAGPSRTGKSYAVECAAEFCHGSPDAMIELEGGELQKEHEVMKLTGAPPSYTGYKTPDEKGDGKPDRSAKLAPVNLELSRNGSSCPIVWIRINEIEKAHPALFDLLLGGTDNGKINLGNNEQVHLGNCIIVMTSNLGMAELQRKPMGFLIRSKTTQDVKAAVHGAMAEEFRPEFRNRIDEVVVFNPLSAEQVRKVVDFEINRIQERILRQVKRGSLFMLEVDDKAKDFILEQSDNSNGGVADMKRSIKRHLEDPLGNELLKGTISLGDKVVVTWEDGEPTLSFYIDDDGGIVGGADVLDVVDTAASHKGLVFQRRVEKATARAKHLPKELIDINLSSDNAPRLMESSAELIHDVQNVFAIPIVAYSLRKEAPFRFTLTVRATEEQLVLLKSAYPEATTRPGSDQQTQGE